MRRSTPLLTVLVAGASAAAMALPSPALAASAGLSLELHRQGTGAKAGWVTVNGNQLAHLESRTGGRAWTYTRGISGTPASGLGSVSYRLLSPCTAAVMVFIRFHAPDGAPSSKNYYCVPGSSAQVVDPSSQRDAMPAGSTVGSVDVMVRDAGAADVDDIAVTYGRGTALFTDSTSAAPVTTSRR